MKVRLVLVTMITSAIVPTSVSPMSLSASSLSGSPRSLSPAALSLTSSRPSSNPFGVFLPANQKDRARVIERLHVDSIRSVVLLEDTRVVCSGCSQFDQTGLDLVLTVRNSSGYRDPSSPPAIMARYRFEVGLTLDQYTPELLVVENEPNARNFFDGTPKQYHEMLAAACDEAHKRGIRCADGGLGGEIVTAFVYQTYVDAGRMKAAHSYARRVALSGRIDPSADQIERRARVGRTFLSGYAGAGADFVNFHWYRPSGSALRETISLLQDTTGLPAVTNEIGQFGRDPRLTKSLMRAVVEEHVRRAVWYSFDDTTRRGLRTYGLQRPDGTLRRHGKAFRRFILDSFS